MSRRFFTLDVFTDRALAGNPLAVVSTPMGLDDAAMQAIAREFNLSETVFVREPRNPINTAAVRIFTPGRELPFAGHPTVGTAVLLAHLRARDLLGSQDLRVVLEEKIGEVVCVARHRRGEAMAAYFTLPRLPERGGEAPSAAVLAEGLGLTPADIGFADHVPSVWSVGAPHICVPVATLDAMARANPLKTAWGEGGGPSVWLYCPEVVARGLALPRPHVRRRLGHRRGPRDRQRRRRLRRRRDGVRQARRRRAHAGHRAGLRDGPAEPDLAGAGRRGRRCCERRPSAARPSSSPRGRCGCDRHPHRADRRARLPHDDRRLGFCASSAPKRSPPIGAAAHAEQPSLFNGRVLMLRRYAVEGRTLRGEYIETDFADFLAWREFGFPASNACNGFSMAALRGADGGFLLGEMSPHTASAGAIYFPAGTPDPQDVFDGDRRSRSQRAARTVRGDGDRRRGGRDRAGLGGRAFARPRRLHEADAAAGQRRGGEGADRGWIAREARPEFSRMHVVRGEADFLAAHERFRAGLHDVGLGGRR